MVRIKHRYLLVNVLYPDPKTNNVKLPDQAGETSFSIQFQQPSSDNLTVKALLKLVRDGVADLFGDYGSGKVSASLQVKYWSPATSTAIIRVSRDHYRLVWAALSFVTSLPKPLNQPCVFQVVRVSGTIRKSEEEAIRRARLSIRRAQRAVKRSAVSGFNVLDHEDDFNMFHDIEDADDPDNMDEGSDEAD